MEDKQQQQCSKSLEEPGGPRSYRWYAAGTQSGNCQECCSQRGGEIPTRSTVADEILVEEIVDILPGGQPLHGSDQFMGQHLGHRPEYQQRDAQPSRREQPQHIQDQTDAHIGQQGNGFGETVQQQTPGRRQKAGREKKKQGKTIFQR
jgi:hypothetical protein